MINLQTPKNFQPIGTRSHDLLIRLLVQLPLHHAALDTTKNSFCDQGEKIWRFFAIVRLLTLTSFLKNCRSSQNFLLTNYGKKCVRRWAILQQTHLVICLWYETLQFVIFWYSLGASILRKYVLVRNIHVRLWQKTTEIFFVILAGCQWEYVPFKAVIMYVCTVTVVYSH
jgi:hypothetical protein